MKKYYFETKKKTILRWKKIKNVKNIFKKGQKRPFWDEEKTKKRKKTKNTKKKVFLKRCKKDDFEMKNVFGHGKSP